MKIILTVILAIFLTGCVTTLPSYKFKSKTRIGLVLQPHKPILCHTHVGFTVFSNFDNKLYDADYNYTKKVKETFKRLVGENGHIAIIIEPSELSHTMTDYYEINSWDGHFKLREEYRKELDIVVKKYNLDVLVLTPSEKYVTFDKDRACYRGAHLQTSAQGFGHRASINVRSRMYAFYGKNLEYIGNNNGYGGMDVSNKYPKDVGNLSSEEIAYYGSKIQSGIDRSIKTLIQNLKLGEKEFKDESYYPFGN